MAGRWLGAVAGVTVVAAVLAGCGPTPEQKAATDAEAKKVKVALLRAEAEAAREKEEAPIKEAALNALREDAFDPSSAQFRNVTIKRVNLPETNGKYSLSTVAVCGEFNGKNKYGGYIGFTPFGYLFSYEINGESRDAKFYVIITPKIPNAEYDLYTAMC